VIPRAKVRWEIPLHSEADGSVTDAANPNGSLANIAGIVSEGGNVVGLMPHPERAAESELPSQDGLPLLRALVGLGDLPAVGVAANVTGPAAR
jgi:hypothetical protein